jgi:uncharacterized protein (UPF0332 family)
MSTKNESIRLKLAKARNLLSEVDILIGYRFYATAVNRLYYACFHATKALLHLSQYRFFIVIPVK